MKHKRILFIILAVLCTVNAFTAATFTAQTIEGVDMKFEVLSEVEKTCRVAGESVNPSTAGIITVPETAEGYTVTELARYAFRYCEKLTSINLPSTLTTIGSCAFRGLTGLTSLVIPEGVTTIGSEAFIDCIMLNSISFPNSLNSIGDRAFVKNLWYNNQPDGVIYAGKVLYDYKGTMPNGTHIDIKEGTVSISNYAFYGCDGLASVSIPNSVKTIGSSSFQSCQNLKSISIPDGVSTISSSAFGGCSSLETVFGGNGLIYMGGRVFEDTKWYNQLPDGLVYVGSVLYTYKGKMPANTQPTIKDGTLSIAGEAFQEYSNLVSIDIPNSLIYIGRQAFSGCSGLSTIVLPQGIRNIDAFAFEGCSKLNTISVPGSVERIGGGAFYKCSGLEKVIVEDLNAWCNICFSDTVGANPLYYAEHLYNSDGVEIKDLVIPSGIKKINNNAFGNCKSLISASLPAGLLSIGYSAFKDCSNMKVISIPNTILNIDDQAFYGCSLESVSLPKSIKSIGQYAFYNNHLTTIEIPRNISFIGSGAFCYNANLTEIYSKIREPFEIFSNTFNTFGEGIITQNLYVPYGTKYKYEATSGWNQFSGHIVEISDSVGVKDIVMLQGKKCTIEVTLDNGWNEDVYTAYQFVLHLPDSIGIATDEEGEYECDLVAGRYQGKTHTLTVTEKDTIVDETGTVWRNYQFICYSNKNKLIQGTEGPLLTMSLLLNKGLDVTVGKDINKYGFVTDFTLSDEKMEGDPVKNAKFKIDLYPAGDVNYDYKVDVKDIVGVVGCINKQIDEKETMIWNAADVNNDGNVNIKDIVNIIEIINNQ